MSAHTSAYLRLYLRLYLRVSSSISAHLPAGLGSNKAALLEFLCGRSPPRIRAAKEAWEGRHDASLVDRFNDELSGDFRTIALKLLRGKRKVDGTTLAYGLTYG